MVDVAFPHASNLFGGRYEPAGPEPANGGDRQRQARMVIELAVTQIFGVDHAGLASDRRGAARIAEARQVAMYLAHVACGLSLTDVGRLFSRDRTTVAHACAVIEDRRDDEAFDRALDLLEWAVPVMAVRMGASETLP
jgi:hypothetical protein